MHYLIIFFQLSYHINHILIYSIISCAFHLTANSKGKKKKRRKRWGLNVNLDASVQRCKEKVYFKYYGVNNGRLKKAIEVAIAQQVVKHFSDKIQSEVHPLFFFYTPPPLPSKIL